MNSTVTQDDLTVNDGLFVVELAFGSGVFDGDARWLELGVRPGNSSDAYTTLDPRQPLVPAPYALYAMQTPWSGLAGVPVASGDVVGTYAVTGGFWAGLAAPTSPVMSISKAANPDPVKAGGRLTYTVTVQNTGVADATGVTITDTLPAHTTFVSASAGGLPTGSRSGPASTSLPGNYIEWTGRTIPTGESLTVTLVVQVANPLPVGSVITNADCGVACAEGETASGNPVTTALQPVPLLTISKTDSPDPVVAGEWLTYTILVQNIGTADATGVTISNTLPVSTTFVSADAGGSLVGDQVRWTGQTVSAGGSLAVHLTVQVEGAPDGPPIVN